MDKVIKEIKEEMKYIYLTKLLNKISEISFEKVRKRYEKISYKYNYFLWNNIFFDNKAFNQNTVTVNYVYKDIVNKDIIAYIPIANYSVYKFKLIDKKNSVDELISELEKNMNSYISKCINKIDFYVKKQNDYNEYLHEHMINVFNENNFKIFNQVIPQNYTLYIDKFKDGIIHFTVKSGNHKEMYFTEVFYDYVDYKILDINTILDNLKKRINRKMLGEINTQIKNLYFASDRLNHTKIMEKTVLEYKDYYKEKEIPFVYNISDSVDEFYDNLDLTINSIMYKKRIKALFYKHLELQPFFKDRTTKVKFINFIDNHLKEIVFTFNRNLVDYDKVLPILENHNLYDDMRELFGMAYINIIKNKS